MSDMSEMQQPQPHEQQQQHQHDIHHQHQAAAAAAAASAAAAGGGNPNQCFYNPDSSVLVKTEYDQGKIFNKKTADDHHLSVSFELDICVSISVIAI
jgi:hypothetical protein